MFRRHFAVKAQQIKVENVIAILTLSLFSAEVINILHKI